MRCNLDHFGCSTVVGAFAQTDCPNPHDSNDDGAVTISDLLDLLSVFGDVDSDRRHWDSVDACGHRRLQPRPIPLSRARTQMSWETVEAAVRVMETAMGSVMMKTTAWANRRMWGAIALAPRNRH